MLQVKSKIKLKIINNQNAKNKESIIKLICYKW